MDIKKFPIVDFPTQTDLKKSIIENIKQVYISSPTKIYFNTDTNIFLLDLKTENFTEKKLISSEYFINNFSKNSKKKPNQHDTKISYYNYQDQCCEFLDSKLRKIFSLDYHFSGYSYLKNITLDNSHHGFCYYGLAFDTINKYVKIIFFNKKLKKISKIEKIYQESETKKNFSEEFLKEIFENIEGVENLSKNFNKVARLSIRLDDIGQYIYSEYLFYCKETKKRKIKKLKFHIDDFSLEEFKQKVQNLDLNWKEFCDDKISSIYIYRIQEENFCMIQSVKENNFSRDLSKAQF